MSSPCDCGGGRSAVNGFLFCAHCDGGHPSEPQCGVCRDFSHAVMARLGHTPPELA
ncbi:hypothetical protein [Desertivibrio insolitus]|uniref:hypothetical protein n=1 Tax=Herbiconiux sp. SYSU D00978 TaxID=2812562 RepID=UPI001A97BA8F|nr:hypothetical protein [Herbiconiux sp. SYSU D00978]